MGRKLLDDGNYDNKQYRFTNQQLLFTNDAWKHAKLGIGNITLPNRQKAYGINAQVLLGDMVIGSNLSIHNANNSFVVDENGATLTNAALSIIGNGGLNKMILDSTNGFKIQKKVNNVFNDMIYLDSNGDANFNGNVYGGSINIASKFIVNADGTVEMASGTLKSFQSLMANGKGLKVNNGVTTIDGDLNVSGNASFDGNISLGGNITWFGGNSTPVKCQYSSDNVNWHTTQSSSDKYRRESWDGGKTWGAGYQFVGMDGSDANVPNYIKENRITRTTIESPKITGGLIEGGQIKVDAKTNSDYSGRSELGIYDTDGIQYGYIRYDVNGGDNEAPQRMFVGTTNKKPLKLYSDTDMSIQAGENKQNIIYIMSDTQFHGRLLNSQGDEISFIARFA